MTSFSANATADRIAPPASTSEVDSPPRPFPLLDVNAMDISGLNHDDDPLYAPPTKPPTVTAVQSTNGDNAAEHDLPNLSESAQAAMPLSASAPLNPMADFSSIKANLAMGLDKLQTTGLPSGSKDRERAAVATTDDDIAYNARSTSNARMMSRHASITSADPNAFILSMPQGNNTQLSGDYPTAIAPSEISLQASFTQESDALTGSADVASASASASQKLESFARIEFADSVFQMTTYAVIIGRDQRALDQARRDEYREERYRRRVEENERQGLPPPTPLGKDRGNSVNRMPSSAASVQQGNTNDQDEIVKSNRQYVSHTEGVAAVDLGTVQPSPSHIPFVGIHSPGPNIAMKTKAISRNHLKIQFNEKKGVFEAVSLHRNGFFCDDVFYGSEHGPVTIRSGDRFQIKDVGFLFVINGVERGKTGGEDLHEEEASSKRYSVGGKEMSFDFEHSDHEKFHDTSDELSDLGDISTPPAGSDDADDADDADDVEDAEEAEDAEEVEEAEDTAMAMEPPSEPPLAPAEPEPQTIQPDRAGDVVMQSAESAFEDHEEESIERRLQTALSADLDLGLDTGLDTTFENTELDVGDAGLDTSYDMDLDSRFDNGIPPEYAGLPIPQTAWSRAAPKDGIMSKRERRLLKKQMLEDAKKVQPQEPLGEKIKRPVGRPRKNPLPENGDRPEKRKYTKRKKEDGEEGSDAEKRAKEKKDKKVRPKSPPLELNREDFTDEQLQKPSKNYGVLIDEALTAGPVEGLHLKQIYKRITAKYPWFYFHAETKGWESSVRHNLLGNDAFKKDDQTGLWSRVPGVELDAGKKRKATTPERSLGPPSMQPHQMAHQQHYYQGSNYMQQGGMHYAHGLPGQGYTGGNQHQNGYHTSSHNAPNPVVQGTTTAHQSYPGQSHNHAPITTTTAPNLAIARQPGPQQQQGAYNSPYARPTPPANPLPKTENTNYNPQTSHIPPAPANATYTTQANQNATSLGANGTSSRVPLSAEVQKVIADWKKQILTTISKSTDAAKAEQIIDTSINRALGIPAAATLPGFEAVETTLVNAVQGKIRDAQNQARTAATATATAAAAAAAAPTTPAAPGRQPSLAPAASPAAAKAPTSSAPSSLEATIQARIKVFRVPILAAFRKRTEHAETIVDTAIKRAQGLPHQDIMPGWEDADRLIVENVHKIITEVRKNHGLQTSAVSPSIQPARSTQEGSAHKIQSASPAPLPPAMTSATSTGQSSSNHNANAHPPAVPHTSPPPVVNNPSAPRPAMPQLSRPGISVARPSKARNVTIGDFPVRYSIQCPGTTSVPSHTSSCTASFSTASTCTASSGTAGPDKSGPGKSGSGTTGSGTASHGTSTSARGDSLTSTKVCNATANLDTTTSRADTKTDTGTRDNDFACAKVLHVTAGPSVDFSFAADFEPK
ncbi:forkhead domain-containing protein [Apiospora hydei]|uniref:Forkhead domain-containing protein n=1 Tax=Apiospora hydei TaxID=1337664 RepID=A0ABR1X2V6_9PEZI